MLVGEAPGLKQLACRLLHADGGKLSVLTTDPGMGIIRHEDAGYGEAKEFAGKNGVMLPMQ